MLGATYRIGHGCSLFFKLVFVIKTAFRKGYLFKTKKLASGTRHGEAVENLEAIKMSKTFYSSIEKQIQDFGFKVVSRDFERPWGAFLVIHEGQAQKFADYFFSGLDVKDLKISGKLSPKILMVSPHAKLSWQYHHRRAEIWQVYWGSVGVIKSDNNQQGDMQILNQGDRVTLAKGERHRLIGLDDFGVVAEIWQHTDSVPSDENDIVRLEDEYNRD